MNLVEVTTTAVDATKGFFAPAGAAWEIIPRIGRAFLIALAVYLSIWILSSIPSLIAPIIGIGFLWIVAYVHCKSP